MASSHEEAIMATRQDEVDEGEPLYSRIRKAQENDNSIRSNLTESGPDIIGVQGGDDLVVQVFDDHWEIWPKDGGD